MGHLDAAALALHLGPGVGAIELNVLELRARRDVEPALASLLLHALPDVLIHLRVQGEVELPGLDHRPGGRGRIPPPFSSTVSKKGRLGT